MNAIHVPPFSRTGLAAEDVDFSLVLGGPLYQLYRRSRLSGDTLELLHRRMLAIVLIAWLPLLVLAVVAGPSSIPVPFWRDCDAQARFLVALPLLVWAELIVHKRTRKVAQSFLDRQVVTGDDLPRFHGALETAKRVRNSITLELALLVLAFTVGQWNWRTQIALSTSTWYAVVNPTGWHLTPAGYWLAFVAVPTFQFILARWYVRMAIWAWLLWRFSRLSLRLNATHPDRAGGLGFLGKCTYAFAPILTAQGAVMSGVIANQVLYQGADLLSFKVEAVALIVFFMVIVLGPMAVFTPLMWHAHHEALGTYGRFATGYVRGFEEKWVSHGGDGEALLGTADIQSLADLANSYDVIREMRSVPFSMHDVSLLAMATAWPLAPLALTVISIDEIVTRLVHILL